MQKQNKPRDRNSSSKERHDLSRQENTPSVHYEIISSNSDKTSRPLRSVYSLDSSGRSTQRRNETALQRLRRKLTKRSKSCADENVSDTFSEKCDITATDSENKIEHIYDVPFAESVDKSKGQRDYVEPFYENGHVWAQNNQIGAQHLSLEREINGRRHASLLNNSQDSQIENGHVINTWQVKSMSLPVDKSPRPLTTRPSWQSSGYSSTESGSDEVPEPESNNLLIRTRSLPVAPKLDINLQFLTGLNDLCKQGWYWGPLSSKEAEGKLSGTSDGSFLVRDSNDNRYLLSLSFRSEMRTLHTRIEFSRGKFSFYAAPFITSGCHNSIVDLIEDCIQQSKDKVFCYSKGRGHNGGAFPVRLTKPISRFDHVCTLQHLCRFIIRQHFTLENITDLPLPRMMKRYLHKNHFDVKQG